MAELMNNDITIQNFLFPPSISLHIIIQLSYCNNIEISPDIYTIQQASSPVDTQLNIPLSDMSYSCAPFVSS